MLEMPNPIFLEKIRKKNPSICHLNLLILHSVLSVTYNYSSFSGVKRRTKEEKEFANFDIFDDPDRPYSTFNFKYTNTAFDRLASLTEFNTLLCKDMIINKIKDCVKRVQKYKAVKRVPIKLKDIKKLKLKKSKEKQLRDFVSTFDNDDGDIPISEQNGVHTNSLDEDLMSLNLNQS